jgi:hypothetical protein
VIPPLSSQPSGGDVERKWTIGMALPGATPDDWLTNVQISGPPVRPGETVEVVPLSDYQGAVERVSVLEQALLIACENDEGGAARYVRMAQAVLADDAGGR